MKKNTVLMVGPFTILAPLPGYWHLTCFQGGIATSSLKSPELTLGMTVIDWWKVSDRLPNAHVMRDVDDEGFFALLTSRLGTLP